MPVYRGTWSARVSQDFEITADTEAEARELLDEEMAPQHVVELHDFVVEDFEEVQP